MIIKKKIWYILVALTLIFISISAFTLNQAAVKLDKAESSLEHAKQLDTASTAVIEKANEFFVCMNNNDKECLTTSISSSDGLGAEWRIARDKFRESTR
jgi:hypothetical protein